MRRGGRRTQVRLRTRYGPEQDVIMAENLKLALVQTHSVPDRSENLAQLAALAAELPADRDLVVLPENILCQGNNDRVRTAARNVAELTTELGRFSRELGAAVLFGGVPVRDAHGIRNSSLVLDRAGQLLARYDKMHLFKWHHDCRQTVDETQLYEPGPEPVRFQFHGWTLALSVCYDLRFPELFRACAPADLMICTAAFTQATGEAHWTPLLRARAIENQCYVAAVNQCGANTDTGIAMYGHSMLVDPWGRPVATAAAEPTVLLVELQRPEIAEARRRLPALEQRRIAIGGCRDAGIGASSSARPGPP